jgi:VWFA-related protein
LVRHIVFAGALAFLTAAPVATVSAGQSQQPAASLPDAPQQHTSQQSIPDGPKPQPVLPDTYGITPGQGTTPESNGDTSSNPGAPQQAVPTTTLSPTPQSRPKEDDGPPPETPPPGQGPAFTIRQTVNFVEVPFTVKDNKNNLVAGLTWRDIRVYENGYRQQLRLFTVDPFPLSVALVIDQSLPFNTMATVNNALGALQGAFTPYDEIAVFSYNNGPRKEDDFTAGQSARLGAVLERAKKTGRDPVWADTRGPLSQNINLNDGALSNTMPLVNSSHGTSQSSTQIVPKEVHTLNDAILAAAIATTKAGKGRRRIVYVISDGKEYGSTAKYKDVVKFCQTNKIAVWGTVVGDSSIPGIGFLDRMHIPFTMRDNLLPQYTEATGGQVDPEFRQKGIEQSFARITEEVRNQYTVGYYSHEPFIDGKYRNIEVRVLRPNLRVIAKKGYFPTPEDVKPNSPSQATSPSVNK